MDRSRRNLVLLTIDACRADFVDSFGGVPLTPTLARLAPHTVRFERAYAGGPWTTPALVSHYQWSSPRPGPSLAGLLKEAGFRVPNLCYLNRLDNYRNLGYALEDAPDYPHSPDDDLLTPALRELRGGRRAVLPLVPLQVRAPALLG